MNKDFSYYLSKFLGDYLVVERNTSSNTIRSYKKTFQLLVDYLINIKEFKLKEITFSNITREIIIDFLNYLEGTKNNTIRTRNQRLGAIKSFYQFCLIDEVENISNINKVLSIKTKKFPKKVINFLTEEELEKLFKSIDTTTKIGRRDLTILVMLYDTASRASEIINLKVEDIHLEDKYIILTGKGNKQRMVPIMEDTKNLIIKYMNENDITEGYLFQNKRHQRMSNDFIKDTISKYQKYINKHLHPHIFRHTRAVHLLDKGVNIVYIQEFLGHACIDTTRGYAKVLEKTKFEAIKKATPQLNNDTLPDWNNDQDLLSQLLNM